MRKLLLLAVMFVVVGCPPPVTQTSTESTKIDTAEKKQATTQASRQEERRLVVIVTRDKVRIETDDRVLEANREQSAESKEKSVDKQSTVEAEIVSGTGNGTLFLLVGGGALVALGLLALIWLRMTSLGLGLIAAGVGIGVAGTFFQWISTDGKWVLIIMGIGLLGGVGYVAYRLLQSKKVNTTLGHIVAAIDATPKAGKTVRNKIQTVAGKDDTIVRQVVEKVKK